MYIPEVWRGPASAKQMRVSYVLGWKELSTCMGHPALWNFWWDDFET